MIGKQKRLLRKIHAKHIMQYPPKGYKGGTVHEYYHRDGKTDLSTMRRDAERRLVDTRFPEESLIHHHSSQESCDAHQHEEYLFKKAEGNGSGS